MTARADNVVLVASIQQSGTHTLRAIVKGEGYRRIMRKPGQFNLARPGDLLHSHFWDRDYGHIVKYSSIYPTVIPLRHPTAVALSWHARHKAHRRNQLQAEWDNLADFDEKHGEHAFYFAMERYPLDELEQYLGTGVHRQVPRLGVIGPYPEKRLWENGEIEQLRRTEAEWAVGFGAETVRDNPVARRFYAE